jgi:hypothetical protein
MPFRREHFHRAQTRACARRLLAPPVGHGLPGRNPGPVNRHSRQDPQFRGRAPQMLAGPLFPVAVPGCAAKDRA